MKKLVGNIGQILGISLACLLGITSQAIAIPPEDSLEQLTSVSQLRDIQTNDWAFAALKNLAENYGCLQGYPQHIFAGDQPMTRYEFAAALKQCSDSLTILIEDTKKAVNAEDLLQLQRLQADFATELPAINSSISKLENSLATLENQQFSPTTKLRTRLITYLGDAFGKTASPANETAVNYRSELIFTTSFTSRDRLRIRLRAGEVPLFDTATEFPQGRLSGPTNEPRLLYGNTRSQVRLNQIKYTFAPAKNLRVILDIFSGDRILSDVITPLSSAATGPISEYGRLNTILYPINLQSGLGFAWEATPWLDMDFYLGSEFGSADNPKIGLFAGGYGASIRTAFNFGALKLGFSYGNSYSPRFGVNTSSGSNASAVIGAGPVIGNTYVAGAFYRFSPLFELGGSVGYINASTRGNQTKGEAEVWDYRLNGIFYDVLKKGNLAGFVVGIQPRLTGTSNSALAEALGFQDGQRHDLSTGWHIETFYTHRLTDNISITPGIFWLTAPNHDARNPGVIVSAIRFSFEY
jgi:hypothetical protein